MYVVALQVDEVEFYYFSQWRHVSNVGVTLCGNLMVSPYFFLSFSLEN